MVSYVSALLYGFGGIVVAGMALLVAFQDKLVYVPVVPGLTKSYPITPARLGLVYEDVWLTSFDGVRLHSWFIKFLPDCRVIDTQISAVRHSHRLAKAISRWTSSHSFEASSSMQFLHTQFWKGTGISSHRAD
ncbi:Alpha/beta hydrolase domain-containing protein wav2 [Orobanche minor]